MLDKIFEGMAGIQEPNFKYFVLGKGDEYEVSVNFIEGGAVVPPHTHDQDVFNFVFEGEFFVDINGEKKLLKKGDWVFMPKDVEHSVEAKTPVSLLELWRI